jgi:hypothetical protein
VDGEFMLQPRYFGLELADHPGAQCVTQPAGDPLEPIALQVFDRTRRGAERASDIAARALAVATPPSLLIDKEICEVSRLGRFGQRITHDRPPMDGLSARADETSSPADAFAGAPAHA